MTGILQVILHESCQIHARILTELAVFEHSWQESFMILYKSYLILIRILLDYKRILQESCLILTRILHDYKWILHDYKIILHESYMILTS